MSWTNNETLLNYSKATPCKEIFQAVCDEIGKHYEKQGLKYSRARPKIVYKDKDIKVEICFWSSRSNIPGESINLEILPWFHSLQLAKQSKTKGYLFGHTGLFIHKYTDNIKQRKIRQIFGDEEEYVYEYSYESIIKDNNNCNVYGLDEQKFKKIIEFIDNKILSWVEKIKTEEGINELIQDPSQTRIEALNLNGKRGNSCFVEYVKTNFPNINIDKWREE